MGESYKWYLRLRIMEKSPPYTTAWLFSGALGVMYLYGIGVKENTDSAYICLKDASDRGNVYAMGNLISLFYKRKLYTKAADLASKWVTSPLRLSAKPRWSCGRRICAVNISDIGQIW